ncbi:hypothetical protein D3C81_742380 [compost metagenome]
MEFRGGWSTALIAAVLLYFDHSDHAVISQASAVRTEIVSCKASQLVDANLANRSRWISSRHRYINRVFIHWDDVNRRGNNLYLGSNGIIAFPKSTVFMLGLFSRVIGGYPVYFEPGSFI